jgi:hypothetical protein
LQLSFREAASSAIADRPLKAMDLQEVMAMDLLMILGTIVFFLIAIIYTVACDKLK